MNGHYRIKITEQRVAEEHKWDVDGAWQPFTCWEFAVHYQMMEGGGFDTVPGCFSDLWCLLGLHCHKNCNALYRLSFFGDDSAMCSILKVQGHVMVPKRLKAREWQVKDSMVFFFLMFYCSIEHGESLPSLVLISSFLLSLFLDTIDSSKMIVVLDLAG